MSGDISHGEDGPSEVPSVDTTWPPAIEHQFLERPVTFTKKQMERVRYRWFHVFMAMLGVAVGLVEYFGSSHAWSSLPQGKLVFFSLLLLSCVGNLWRAYQGWQLKALLDRSQARLPQPQKHSR